MSRYLTGLAATGVALGSIKRNASERRVAVNTFLSENWQYDKLTNSYMLSPMPQSPNTESPLLSAFVDDEPGAQTGDYGVLVPGQKEELSFHAYGNVVDDSSGIISTVQRGSWLRSCTDGSFAIEVQGSPQM